MAVMFVFIKIKTTRQVNSFSVEMKKVKKMEASIIYTPLYDIKFILKPFFGGGGTNLKLEIVHKGEMCSLRNTSRMQNIDFVD